VDGSLARPLDIKRPGSRYRGHVCQTRKGERELKVVIDRERCSGHGRCYTLAPDVFEADDGGYAVLKHSNTSVALRDKVDIGMDNCPERAISVAE
jgi:ferredoxin